MKTFEGQLVATNEKFCIIISRFNEFIGSKLLSYFFEIKRQKSRLYFRKSVLN